MKGHPPRPWPLRRLLLAAYVGLLGAALFAVSLGIKVLLGRYLDRAVEQSAREATAESWGRLGLPATEFWSSPNRGGVIVTQGITAAHIELLVRDLARPERIVRWRAVGSDVTVQAGGRPPSNVAPGKARGPTPPPPGVQWWGLRVTSPTGTLGILEMGLDRSDDLELMEALGRYLFFCSAAVLLLAVLICSRLSSYWLEPLQELDRTFESLAEGDLTARPPESEAAVVPSEWGRLRQSADRMAARLEDSFTAQRRFISDASHELRTPLTAITAMAELLQSKTLTEQARMRAQNTILQEGQRMSRLIEDLLALSRADEGRPLPEGSCLLRETLTSLVDELAESHPGRTVSLDCPNSAEVEVPSTLVRTVLRNLLENALRYSDHEVNCRVSAPSSGQLQVSVEDTGCGIPEEDILRVFERFYRADHSRSRATGGSGLGLSIVKMMVERTGGRIQLSSQVGQGTAVKVTWKGVL